ncbi:acyl-CoA thioesterase [Natronomonas sp. EA1]|uniref:acyl-CoA thioesterase n=1 Tax=Natronomonas sp. EA1 TaxID=3421655 RepID=UPI003EBC8711
MSFDYVHEITVRYRDLDPMQHVNNAVYSSYLEQARVAYLREVLGINKDPGMVVAHLELDFKRAVEFSDEQVAVACRIPELGEKSFRIEYEIRTDDGVAATAETVQVAFDREVGASRPIPDDWREAIQEFEGR